MPRREMIGEAYVKLGIDDRGFASDLQKDVAMVKTAAREMSTAEAVVKINGDNTGYNSALLRTRASLEAAKRLLEAKKIKIGVETNVHQAKKELYELRDLLDDAKYRASINYHPAGTAGGVGGQRLTKVQIADNERLVKSLQKQVTAQNEVYNSLKRKAEIDAGEARLKKQRSATLKSMSENTRRLDEVERTAEDNRIRSAKTLEAALSGLSGRKQKLIAQDILAAGGLDNYLFKLKEELQIRKEANKVRQAHGMSLLPDDPRKEKNRFWSILTNSDNMRETLGKLMREPVKLGPFTATIKGLTVGAAALGPVILGLTGALSAMAGAVGGSLVGAFALGTAALGGFGQAALGIGLVMQPIVKEFKLASQVTNAYGTAVAKYGKESDQAKKKQQEMNSVLKNMSPTARAAYLDLAKVQTVFAKMTQDARPALESALRGTMNFFRQSSPGFAKNTVQATKTGAKEFNMVLDRLNSARNRGDDPLNTMFTNANKALGPLIQGMDYLFEAIIKIGASASRYLAPLAKTLRNAFVFKGLDNTSKLNKQIDGIMKDFYSVAGAISSAGGLLTDFFNAGRGAGRGLFDSLGSTFNRWDKFIKENPEKIKQFFEKAADGARAFGRVVTFLALGFVQLARVVAPVAEGFAWAVSNLVKFMALLLKIPGATRAVQLFGVALGAAFVTTKITAMVASVTKLISLLTGAPAKIAKVAAAFKGLSLVNAVIGGRGAAKGAQKALPTFIDYAMVGGESAAATAGGAGLGAGAAKAGGAAAGASRALMLFGSAARLMTGPVGLATVIVGAAVVSFVKYKDNVEKASDAYKKFISGNNEHSLAQENQNITDRATAYDALRQSISGVAAAQEAFNNSPTPDNLYALNTAQGQRYLDNKDYKKRMEDAMKPTQELIDGQKKLLHTGKELENAQRYGGPEALKGMEDENAAIQAGIDKLEAKKKAYQDFSGMRIKLGLGEFDNAALYDSLAQIRKLVQNKKITAKIATTVQTPEDMERVRARIELALKHKIPLSTILDVITKAHGLDDLLKKLDGLSHGRTVPVSVTGNAYSKLTSISNKLNGLEDKSVSVSTNYTSSGNPPQQVAEGYMSSRYMPAASGYTKSTAAGSARRRPMRRAMGKFNEPTFLVGEENRSEYVIATNPAYRTQNRRYLSQAAGELGMSVIPAARGYSRNELEAKALISGKEYTSEKTALNKKIAKKKAAIAKYKRDHADGGYTRGETHSLHVLQNDLADLRTKRNRTAGTVNWVVKEAKRLEQIRNEITLLKTQMSNDETRGDVNSYNKHRRSLESRYGLLGGLYRMGLKGAHTAASKTEINQLLADLDSDKLNLAKSSLPAAQQAKIDQLNTQLTTARNESVINSMFGSTAGGLSDIIASGGPRRSSRGFAPVIHINTLVPSDQATLDTIGQVVVGAMSTQGGILASSMGV